MPEPAPCSIPAGTAPTPALTDPARTVQAVQDYLNGGGSVDTLAAILKTAGRAPSGGQPVLSLDINGDAWLDLAVAYVDPFAPQASTHGLLQPARQPPSRGLVALYLCQGTRYIPGEPVLEAPDATPILHLAGELSRDGVTDLVVGWETCGAHTCYQELEAVMAEGSTLARAPLDPTSDLPYPEVRLLPDGRLAVTGTGIASAGAGPFRQITRAWSWEPEQRAFVVDTETLEAPRFRIHVLLDGEAAARGGDWHLALDLYHRVVVDDTLLDWADPPSERAILSGYSMYRTVVAYASKGDQGDAKVAYGILQNQYLGGSMGRAYAELATAFWDAYTPAGDLELGCRAARAFAEAHRTEVLDPLYFGYANPTFKPGDVCPASGT